MALSITIEDAPRSVQMHGAIPVRIRVRNDGDVAASAPDRFDPPPVSFALLRVDDPEGDPLQMAGEGLRDIALGRRPRGGGAASDLGPGKSVSFTVDLAQMLTAATPVGEVLLQAWLTVGGETISSPPRPLRFDPLAHTLSARIVTTDGRRLASVFGGPDAVLLGEAPAGRPDLTTLHVIATPNAAPRQVTLALELEASPLWRWAAWRSDTALHALRVSESGVVKTDLSLALPDDPARLLPGYQFADGSVFFPVALGAPGNERLALARFDAHGAAELSAGEPPGAGLRALAVAVGLGPDGFRAWAMGVAAAEGGGERLMLGPLRFPDLTPQGPMAETVATDGAVEALAVREIGVGAAALALLRNADGGARAVAVDLVARAGTGAMPLAATRVPVERIVLAEGEIADIAALGAIGPNVALAVDGPWRRLRTSVSADTALALIGFADGAMWLLTDDPQTGFGYERVDAAGAGAEPDDPDDADKDVDAPVPDDPDEDDDAAK